MNPGRFISVGFRVVTLLAGCLTACNRPYSADRIRRDYEDFLLSHSRAAISSSEYPDAADNPGMAAYRDFIMTMDPVSRLIPGDKLIASIHEVERRKSLKSGSDIFSWEEIPSVIGGRVRAMMYDPVDPARAKVWAGGVSGGLWHCDNIHEGKEWEVVDDFWPSLSISSMDSDPNDPNIFYVGTGEGQTAVLIYRESSGRGSGIWKSVNAGESWEQLESTTGFEYVTDIRLRNEKGTSVIYAGVVSGIYKGEVHLSKPSEGLYRSADGGINWTQVLPKIPGESVPYSPADIEISPSGRIFVGTMRNINNKGGGTILFSDDGFNWTLWDDYNQLIHSRADFNIPGRVILAAAPSDSSRLYAILAAGSAFTGFVYSRGVFILRSDNAGEDWKSIPMPDDNGDWSFIAWHALAAAVDPVDPDIVWVGGLDLYRSANKGLTWDQMSLWYNFGPYYEAGLPNYVHADHHVIRFNRDNPKEMLFATDGGVFLTGDGSVTEPSFTEMNNGFNTLQYYTCYLHPMAGYRYFLSGAQDNGSFRTTNLPTSLASNVSYGDGAYCFIDEDEPWIQITGSQFNSFYISSDGFHQQVNYYNYDGGTFINPMDYDYQANIMYLNGMDFEGHYADQIARIHNIPESPVFMFVHAGTGSNVPFSAVRVSPWKDKGKTTVFLGSQSGKLFRLDNAQSKPVSTDITGNNFPAANISSVNLGSTADHLLVTFSNYGIPSVWLSSNGGDSWKDISGDLPDIPVRWGTFYPDKDSVILLATELGIWFTQDPGQDEIEWTQSITGLPNVRVDMIRIRRSDQNILAATHGRGLFLSEGLQVEKVSDYGDEERFSVFPNPTRGAFNIRYRADFTGEVSITVSDLSGKVFSRDSYNKAKVQMAVYKDFSDYAAGNYLITLTAGSETISKQIIKI